MKGIKYFVIIILSLLAFDSYSQYARLQSGYIYNFCKYIEWEEAYQTGDFIIGVIGDSPIIPELRKLASAKKINNQKIVIREYANANEILQCHIIFIPKDKSNNIKEIKNKVSSFCTLLISEKKGLAKAGSAINFVIIDGKLKFELNKSNATKYGIKVSSTLESLAIIVK